MRRIAVLLAVASIAAACSDGDGAADDPPDAVEASTTSTSTSTTTSSTTPATTTTSAPPCGAGDLTEGVQTRTLTTANGDQRDWLLYVPAGLDVQARPAAVFTFHGAGSSMDAQLAYSNFGPLADGSNALVVSPNGELDRSFYGSSRAWDANLRKSDVDIDFSNELVELIRDEYCVGSVYAAGMSAGGDMVAALACQDDSPFEAFGPVTYLYYDESDCGDAPARPIMYFHGTDDLVVPLAGNPTNDWADPPVPDVMQRWADHNGCDPEPLEEAFTTEVTRISWEECAAPVEWYLVRGGGHTWPGAIDIGGLGYTTQEIDASALLWDFFLG
ncbi:MAG: hypothetical protein AAF548_07870 [Actinomycetota bacterium]